MDRNDYEHLLHRSLDDGRLDRKEKAALRRAFHDLAPSANTMAFLRHLVFAEARAGLAHHDAGKVLDWIEETLKTQVTPSDDQAPRVQAYFSPGEDCRRRLIKLIELATTSIDVCVYTITDNNLANPLIRAARDRRLTVRVLTDTEKQDAPGSDIERFRHRGIAVATDTVAQFMHHKFALFDRRWLATGSFNWTTSATEVNHENIIVTDDPRLVDGFQGEFERLWGMYAD